MTTAIILSCKIALLSDKLHCHVTGKDVLFTLVICTYISNPDFQEMTGHLEKGNKDGLALRKCLKTVNGRHIAATSNNLSIGAIFVALE